MQSAGEFISVLFHRHHWLPVFLLENAFAFQTNTEAELIQIANPVTS